MFFFICSNTIDIFLYGRLRLIIKLANETLIEKAYKKFIKDLFLGKAGNTTC